MIIKMIVVIIAGGSGTRLWPLSTPEFPKHLLKLTNEFSLLQNTVNRTKGFARLDEIFVVTEASHAKHVREQLAELPKKNILIEPSRRGTAACVIYALSEIKKRKLGGGPILFLWADHLVRDNDGFMATALRAGEIAHAENRLVFIGVEPRYAATGFGYMERNGKLKNWQNAYHLASFHEKPDHETANQYFRSGKYFWNTGYLVGDVSTFEEVIRSKSKPLWKSYQKLLTSKDIQTTYEKFKLGPMEKLVSEKVDNAIVVPGSFDWMDIGSFRDLHSISLQDEEGNHIRGESIVLKNATNCYVRNDVTTPVAVIGLDNVVIVNTPNGILVSNKNYAQDVGEVSKQFS